MFRVIAIRLAKKCVERDLFDRLKVGGRFGANLQK
jgi:hypothetical protein